MYKPYVPSYQELDDLKFLYGHLHTPEMWQKIADELGMANGYAAMQLYIKLYGEIMGEPTCPMCEVEEPPKRPVRQVRLRRK